MSTTQSLFPDLQAAPMKAITLTQPWASLLVMGFKRIETRSWNTRYTGPLTIHAGQSMPCKLGERLTLGEFEVERDRAGLLLRGPIAWPYRLPQGAIIGTCELMYTRSTDSSECKPDDRNRSLGDFSLGRYAWYLSSARRFPTTACKGALGLWTVPAEIAAALSLSGVPS